MRKRMLWISVCVVLVVIAALLEWRLYKASIAQTTPQTSSTTETGQARTPNKEPTETEAPSDAVPVEPSTSELNEVQRALSSGDILGIAQLVSVAPDRVDPQFLAELQQMNLQLEKGSLTELETGIWGIAGTDDRGNSWQIALLRSGESASLRIVGTKYLGVTH